MSCVVCQNNLSENKLTRANKTRPTETNNLNFRLARDHVVRLKTAVNLCPVASGTYLFFFRHFFSSFFCFSWKDITEHLMTGLTKNSEFCFP